MKSRKARAGQPRASRVCRRQAVLRLQPFFKDHPHLSVVGLRRHGRIAGACRVFHPLRCSSPSRTSSANARSYKAKAQNVPHRLGCSCESFFFQNFQSIIPFLHLALPAFVTLLIIRLRLDHTVGLGVAGLYVVALHAPANAVALIYFVTPLRAAAWEAVSSWLCGWKLRRVSQLPLRPLSSPRSIGTVSPM